MRVLRILILINFLWFLADIQGAEANQIYSTQEQRYVAVAEFVGACQDSDILIFGENHDDRIHHQNQENYLSLIKFFKPISVNMEFISFDQQQFLDQYQTETLSEDDFLNSIGWGGLPFEFYRPLIQLGFDSKGTFGINAPKSLTQKISKSGLNSLSIDELSLLPPDFELGQDLYRQRFRETMTQGGHQLPEDKLQNYFAAQSVWDESMAFHTLQNYAANTLSVIIVGNFHVEHQLGLSHRLQVRAPRLKTLSIVQLNITNMTDREIQAALEAHPDYGFLADYVVLTLGANLNVPMGLK